MLLDTQYVAIVFWITCCKQWGFCHVHQRFYTRHSLEQCPFLLVRESIPKAGLAVGSAHDLVWVVMVYSSGQVGKLAYFCDLLKSIWKIKLDCGESYLDMKTLSDSICFLLAWELLGRLRASHLLNWIVEHETILTLNVLRELDGVRKSRQCNLWTGVENIPSSRSTCPNMELSEPSWNPTINSW